ncbi:unnamed protein product [Prorocentrum cordatum]|uniref:Uncharacterized protein n=1 Tax=Prorocentrum cordatum TaxID=2364126 RepID=A0ABN9Q7T3_9DINO|nr:unnamed protein product [Polarella glacialis]
MAKEGNYWRPRLLRRRRSSSSLAWAAVCTSCATPAVLVAGPGPRAQVRCQPAPRPAAVGGPAGRPAQEALADQPRSRRGAALLAIPAVVRSCGYEYVRGPSPEAERGWRRRSHPLLPEPEENLEDLTRSGKKKAAAWVSRAKPRQAADRSVALMQLMLVRDPRVLPSATGLRAPETVAIICLRTARWPRWRPTWRGRRRKKSGRRRQRRRKPRLH